MDIVGHHSKDCRCSWRSIRGQCGCCGFFAFALAAADKQDKDYSQLYYFHGLFFQKQAVTNPRISACPLKLIWFFVD
jgi:hypothetical protein